MEKILPGWLRERLEVLRPVLAVLDAQIAGLTCELERAAPAGLPTGQGKLTSVVLSREICDWSRFHNRRQVSSYTGLCPGEYSSGGKRVPGSVTKHGNPRIRAALVELAWRMVRFQPGYPPVRKRLSVLARGAKATGAASKKAIVAVARQLARPPTSLPIPFLLLGRRSVAAQHRPLHRRATRPALPDPSHSPGSGGTKFFVIAAHALERGACSQPDLGRQPDPSL